MTLVMRICLTIKTIFIYFDYVSGVWTRDVDVMSRLDGWQTAAKS